MFTAYVVITVVAAAANGAAATLDLIRSEWVLTNMTRMGVPHSQMVPLGVLKAAGALGLLVGIGVPLIGLAASVGLAAFFLGAIGTAVRARWYAHIPIPAGYLLLAAGSLALGLATW